jgi:hypothetical protein
MIGAAANPGQSRQNGDNRGQPTPGAGRLSATRITASKVFRCIVARFARTPVANFADRFISLHLVSFRFISLHRCKLFMQRLQRCNETICRERKICLDANFALAA